MKKVLFTLTTLLTFFFAADVASGQCTAPGDTSVYGDHAWNVYAFNSGYYFDLHDGSSWSQAYSGYYVDTALNFDPSTQWDPAISPSYAPGYTGCPVNKTTYSWSAKRQGFACGVYDLKMESLLGEAQLFVNGVQVMDITIPNSSSVWTGFLNDSSRVVFRVTTGAGYGLGILQLQLAPIAVQGQAGNCPGNPVQLTAPLSDSYSWSTGETTPGITVTQNGNYTVDIVVNGCNRTLSQEMTFIPIDTPVLQLLTSNSVCDGSVQVIIANVQSSVDYIWNSPNMIYNQNSDIYSTKIPGTYELTASKPTCSASAFLTVVGPPLPADEFGKNTWTVKSFSYTHPDPFLYAGYYMDTTLQFNNGNQWDPASNPSTAAGYQGCGMSDEKFSWSAQRHGFPCGQYQLDVLSHDDSAQLFIDGELVWQAMSASSSPLTNVWTGTLTANTKIQFLNTNMTGAAHAALSFNKLSSSAPLISVTGNSITCTGQFYTLTSIAGASYLWSDGSTVNPLLAGQSGSYSVTLIDSNGCSLTSDPVSVTVLPDPAPVAHITSSATSICNWNPVMLTSDSPTGNFWTTGESTQSISVSVGGDYSLTVSNNAGCTSSSMVHINSGFTPPSPTASNDGPVCNNYPVTLKAGGLAPGGKVLSLDGVSGYLLVDQQIPQSNFLPANNFTIELWIKTTESIAGILSSTDYFGGPHDHSLFLFNGYLFAHNGIVPISTLFPVNDGKWHHIAYVVQSGAGQKIYVDGALASFPNNLEQPGNTYHALYIGMCVDPNTIYGSPHVLFKGEMDNLRIWKEPRTLDDIRANMFLETPLSSTNLQYQFNFNGDLNAVAGNDAQSQGSYAFTDPDYFLYSWTGSGAPTPSTSETQMTSVLAQSGTYQVTASLSNCPASLPASTAVTVSSSVSYYADGDGDGYGGVLSPAIISCTSPGNGYVKNNTDCDDNNAGRHPGLAETCNGIDDNCNGQTDEGVGTVYYADADGDGFGNPNASQQACVQPTHYITDHNDCNDANAAVHPGVIDFCNSIDDNCNGVVDENAFTAAITPSGIVTVCKGSSVTLTANTGANIYYAWYKNGQLISGASGSTYVATKAGKYAVSESNLICFSGSNSTQVKISTLPTAAISYTGSLNICNNPALVLQANSGAGFTYQWMKGANNIAGATNQTYKPATKGTYKVVVTNNSQCSKTSAGVKVTNSCKEDGSEDENNLVFSLYPNPADGNVMLELTVDNETDGQATITICNGLGQIVYDHQSIISGGNLREEIHLNSSLSNGIYFVKVSAGDKRLVKQLVLQR